MYLLSFHPYKRYLSILRFLLLRTILLFFDLLSNMKFITVFLFLAMLVLSFSASIPRQEAMEVQDANENPAMDSTGDVEESKTWCVNCVRYAKRLRNLHSRPVTRVGLLHIACRRDQSSETITLITEEETSRHA